MTTRVRRDETRPVSYSDSSIIRSGNHWHVARPNKSLSITKDPNLCSSVLIQVPQHPESRLRSAPSTHLIVGHCNVRWTTVTSTANLLIHDCY